MQQQMQQQQQFIAAVQQKVQELSAIVDAKPNDCHKELAMWGQLLLELAMMSSGAEAELCITQATEKLEKAISQLEKEEYVAALGNALNVRAFTVKKIEEAQPYFNRAAEMFKRAKELSTDPSMQEKYEKMIASIDEAPNYHAKIMAEMEQQNAQAAAAAPPAAAARAPAGAAGPAPPKATAEDAAKAKAEKRSQFVYDVIGWGIVIAGAVIALRYMGQQ